RVANGSSDAAIVTREPSAGERRRGIAEQRLGELIAVVVAHPDNPLGAITSAALRDVLRGATLDWAELGGPGGEIRLVLPAPGPSTAASADERWRIVAGDVAALTVVSLAAASRARTKPLRIDSIEPSLAALRGGRYPFAAPIVLVHRGSEAGRAFAAALRGPD